MKAKATIALSTLDVRSYSLHLGELVIVAFFALLMGLPVVLLLINSFNGAAPHQQPVFMLETWARAFSDRQTLSALWMSFLISLAHSIPSMILAVIVAWLISRTNMPGGDGLEFLCWFAYFVPDFPLTLAWILLLDPNFGVLNLFARAVPWIGAPLFDPYGFWGIVWVHLSTGGIWFKVMLLAPIFRRMGATLEEASIVAGADGSTTFRRITLPVLSPMILAVAAFSFIRGLESFNIELLLGTPVGIYVYATRIYDYIRQEPPAYGEATALGSLFLVVLALLVFLYQRYIRERRKFAVVTGQGYSTSRLNLGKWKYVALAGCLLYFSVMMILPLAFLAIGSLMRRYGFFDISSPFTLAHWQNMLTDPIFLVSLKNSLVIATATAVAGILLYSTVAYLLVTKRLHAAQLIDFLCWLPWVVPGILMSLALLWLFLATPLRAVLYGSLWGITLAMTIKDSPVSVQAFKAAFLQLGPDLEEAARVSGASWPQLYRRILLPLVAPMAATVGLLNFGSALTSISTPVLLYSAQSRPLSILLLEYNFTGELERAAALGLLITAVICVMMLVGRRLGLQLVGER